jgi:oxygen-independent coproporphyrinogen-3 oxidase
MYLWSLDRLERAGYDQYEISNVARPGLASRHNLKYWQDGEWLGFGCGAHSTRDGVRWKNVSSTEEYIERLAGRAEPAERLTLSLVVEQRRLTPAEQFEEAVFTGLRLSEGIDFEAIGQRYRIDAWGTYGKSLEPFLVAGLVVREAGRLRLSREGMLLANEILQVFV